MRRPWRAPARHLAVAALSLALVGAFAAAKGPMHPVHLWNRAWADAALVLLALTLGLGPLARLWPRAFARWLPWRRELGVWFALGALVHVAVYAQAFDGDWLRFVRRGTDADPVWLRTPFAVANWVGALALVYAAALAATSNDRAVRWLGRGWKFLQRQSYTLFVLTALHAAVFALLVYPSPGADVGLNAALWGAGALALALQLAGFVRTVGQGRWGGR